MFWLAFACICAACLIIGYIAGVLIPLIGFSEGTAHNSWLMNRKLGDHVLSLRKDEISYVQFDLEEYTITFQKIRIYHPAAVPDLSDYTALEEEDYAPENH